MRNVEFLCVSFKSYIILFHPAPHMLLWINPKHCTLSSLKRCSKFYFPGGLDDALNNILNLCTSQGIPFVFALGRRSLGRACGKLVPVSTVGVFNYDGSEVSIGYQLKYGTLVANSTSCTLSFYGNKSIVWPGYAKNNYNSFSVLTFHPLYRLM